jgi:TonB-dependent receptor
MDFNLPADRAENSLKRLSEQSGIEVLFPTDAVAGVRTNAVRGEMTARAALDAMLSGTGLVAVQGKNSNSLSVRRESTLSNAGKKAQGRPAGDRAAAGVSASGPAGDGSSEPPPGTTGAIEGRVISGITGSYLPNVRIAIEGSTHEAVTDQNGAYRLSGIPAGEVRVRVAYIGLGEKAELVRVQPGQSVERNFELQRLGAVEGEVVQMADFVVIEDREMTAQALAINEQRNAPNIKNVVSYDEYPHGTSANIADFLQFLPGVGVTYSGYEAAGIQVRGMPDTDVTIDGNAVTSWGAGRGNSAYIVPVSNISRIEVTKVPTPDMPATGLGGSVNVISKSGFEKSKPLFTYNLHSLSRTDSGYTRFGKINGPYPYLTARLINPNLDLTYMHPISKSLAITVGASRQLNYINTDSATPGWDRVQLVQRTFIFGTAPNLVLTENARVGFDWRLGGKHAISTSVQYRNRNSSSAGNRVTVNYGTGATGDANHTQGTSNGVGSLTQTLGTNTENQSKVMVAAFKYGYAGDVWSGDLRANYSETDTKFNDMANGYFGSVAATITNLVIRGEGIDGSGDTWQSILPTSFTVANRSGAPVDIFDGNAYTINSATSVPRAYTNKLKEIHLNLKREFGASIPWSLKVGTSLRRMDYDQRLPSLSYTFRPGVPIGDRLAGLYGAVDPVYSADTPLAFGSKVQWITGHKVYQVYERNPEYFVLNEPTAHQTAVTNSKYLQESIYSGYLRADLKLMKNRLWIVTGVRYELTDDKGWGPLDDPSAQYVKDASGKLVLGSNGQPTLITTDALARSKLRYSERAVHAERDYDGFFPSLNATYSLTEKILVRVGYARTIGRPDLSLIIPGTNYSDPASATRRITVVNTGLKPWTANSYDLTLDTYFIKNGFGSIGVFQKDLQNFFGASQTAATPALLALYGIPQDGGYLDYDIVTQMNTGDARVRGLEFTYRQSLTFLPHWARGLQVFVNLTHLKVEGSNEADFTGFNPRTLSYGVNFIRPRYLVKFTISDQGETRRTPVAASATNPPDTYVWQAAMTRPTLTGEYQISKHLTVYGTLSDFLGDGFKDVQRTHNPDTPEYAMWSRYQHFGTKLVVGMKGEF